MNRTIVITGASDGIGASAARSLAAEGDHIAVVGRTASKVEKVAAEVGGRPFVADFAKLTDVERLAGELLDAYPRIDILANNAGGLFDKRVTTEDGHELTFQVNHLAPFLLTKLLMDRLIESQASIINTASHAHYRARLNVTDLELNHGWRKWLAYSNSKLLNILFTKGLHQRYVLDGVHAVSFHPGVVKSSFAHDASGATGWFYRSELGKRTMVTPEQGADTLVWLADGTPPRDWAPGFYYTKRAIAHTLGAARDAELADAVWAATESMLN